MESIRLSVPLRPKEASMTKKIFSVCMLNTLVLLFSSQSKAQTEQHSDNSWRKGDGRGRRLSSRCHRLFWRTSSSSDNLCQWIGPASHYSLSQTGKLQDRHKIRRDNNPLRRGFHRPPCPSRFQA